MMKTNFQTPDYKAIFKDILKNLEHEICSKTITIMSKENLTISDVIKLNDLIFKNSSSENSNQKFRSYDKSTIMDILDFQHKNGYNNSQLAHHFKLSRNSVAKWKKVYCR